jgi:hypothetical protein
MKVEPLAALQFMKPELAGCNIASSADWGAHGSNLWWRVLVEPMESYQAISNKWREFGAASPLEPQGPSNVKLVNAADPVGAKIVASFARPRGVFS